MSAIPHIIVQLVHIEGPLKGEIQDFSIPDIFIGRHPDCQVQFPREVVTLSRRHAHIVREGNRFKLIDKSTNGTFVNGQRVTEAYLKDGDVITFSEGGPKVSFLTQVSDQPAPASQTPQQAKPPETPFSPQAAAPPYAPPVSPSAPQPAPPFQQPPPPQPAPVATPPSPPLMAQPIKAPFAIQYGPALKSFQSLPITLGKGANCDFVVNHPALLDQQAQIFFGQDQYWIKDLTGTNAIRINGIPIAGQTALRPDMQVSLSPQGPKFRFLGGGRLVEVEDPLPEAPVHARPSPPEVAEEKQKSHKTAHKKTKLFKRLFSS